jgi:tetrahydromethanopterin S-methyltransferase subunit E
MIMQIAGGIVVGVIFLVVIAILIWVMAQIILHVREKYYEYEDELDDYTSDDDDLKIYKNLDGRDHR